jgi:hypothetical protein
MEILTYDDLGRTSSTLSVIHSHILHLDLKNLRRGGGRKKVEQDQALCILNLQDTNLTNAGDSLKVLQLKQFKIQEDANEANRDVVYRCQISCYCCRIIKWHQRR